MAKICTEFWIVEGLPIDARLGALARASIRRRACRQRHASGPMNYDIRPPMARALGMFIAAWCVVTSCVSAAVIDTVAGTGEAENNGDQGIATKINVGDPFGVELGPHGALYVTEVRNHRVRRVDLATGKISTVAGTGRRGYSGDGGPATAADLNEPYEVRFDSAGNMYFVEMQNHVVRRVDADSGVITTIAGTGVAGFGGDGGPATEAMFHRPHSIALDGQGHLYIADIGNHRIRRLDLETGIVDSIAGTPNKRLPVDGQVAKGQPILGPRALFIDGDTMWIALREGHSVWRMNLQKGRLHQVAGTGDRGYSGDGGPAKLATFDGPKGLAVGPEGHVYVVDTENQAIRKIDMETGLISTIVGTGQRGGAGDGGLATAAKLARPHGICVGPDGTLFIGDTLNHRVRVVRAVEKDNRDEKNAKSKSRNTKQVRNTK